MVKRSSNPFSFYKLKKNFRKHINPVFISAVLCAFFIYSGIIEIHDESKINLLFEKSDITKISGKIISSPQKSALFGGTYSFSVKSDFVSGKLKNEGLITQSSENIFKLFVSEKIQESLNPGKLFSVSNLNFINKGNIIIEEGAYIEAEIEAKNNFFMIKKIERLTWERKFQYFRALCRLHFRRLLKSWGEAGGFLLALLSGSRDETDVSLQNGFKNAGVSHILALSGMHLSIFSGIAVLIGDKTYGKRIADILRFFAITFFVWFAGLSPSLLRALLCSMIILVSTLLRFREPSMINVLSLSFLIQASLFPSHLKQPAFILSYGALSGILIFSPFISSLVSKRIFPKLRQSFSSSVAAQIFTSPYSLKTFGKISLASVPASIVLSPLVTFFIYIGLSCIVLSVFLPFMRGPCSMIIQKWYFFIVKTVELFKNFPYIFVEQ